MKTIFWIAVAIDSVLIALIFFSILGDSFTNAAPQVGGKLLVFLLLPLALGAAICLFMFGTDIVAHRLALFIVLTPLPGVVAYGFYQDYADAQRVNRTSELSVGAPEALPSSTSHSALEGAIDPLQK